MTGESQETSQYDPSRFAPSLKPGAVLNGRYRIEEELGRGGMGIVFRGVDQDLQREVAVKVVPRVNSSPELRERLLREARAAAGLNHPHVITVFDVGEDRGVPYFVMELVPGTSLADRRPQDIPSVIALGRQICSALDHAHSHGIVHRDLKPDNLLFAGEDHLKLADLGLAFPAAESRITQAGRIVGTAAYMPPEQALGQIVDGRSDLYSLGVILYELATGRLPFTGMDPLAIVSQHVHAPVVPPRAVRSDVPLGLETVILRLLAKDPAKRYSAAKDVDEALARALETRPDADAEGGVATVALLDALSRGRLVGRESELAEARELWRRALTGRGHCVLLSGEPGAGKTRLGRELLVQAALDGATILTGACYEFEATTPYLPFADAFRRWVHEHGDDDSLRDLLGDTVPHLAKFAPELESRLGPFPPRPELPAQEERLLFFDAVVLAFRGLAQKRGLIFYIDDLHWADSGTLWLLGRLLRQIREETVLVVGSYRETEVDRAHPLGKALVDWNRERLTTRIYLRRFDRDDTQALLETLLGDRVSDDFADAVHGETEGNPFFIEEVLKSLIEEGQFRRKSGKWEKPKTLELTIPQSVMEAIGSRLNRVSSECNEILRAAAVVGKTFQFEELLAASGGKDEEALLDALDEAVAAQVLTAERDESFSFTHDKIREVLYKELNPIRRRRLHRRTAEGLRALKDSASIKVEALAHHYIEAGDFEEGMTYAKEAAREAERVHAYDEAIAAYIRARDCAEALDLTQEQGALEEAIAVAYGRFGKSQDSARHYDRALGLTTEPKERLRLKSMAAASYVTTGDSRGLDHAREVLAAPESREDSFIALQAMSIEGRFHHLAGRSATAAEILQRAVDMTQDWDPRTLTREQVGIVSDAHSYLAGALQHLGRFDDSDRVAERCTAVGEAAGDLLAQAFGYEFRGENALSKGEWETGLTMAARERELARQVNSRDRYAWTTLVVSMSHQGLGDLERAQEEAREGVELARSLGELRLEGLMRCFLADILSEQGSLDEALAQAQKAFTHVENLGQTYLLGEAHRCATNVHLARQEYEKALEHAGHVVEIGEKGDSVVSRMWVSAPHLEVLLALEKGEEARKMFNYYSNLFAPCQSRHFISRLESFRERVMPGEEG